MNRRILASVVSIVVVSLTAVSVSAAAVMRAPAAPARAAKPVPPFQPDFFGMSMGADLIQASDALFDKEMNTMQKMGVHWVRASIPWSLVQLHGPDGQNWIRVDRLVETVQAEGMQLIGIIDSPPIWAGTSVPPVPGCSAKPPFDLQAYANFAAAVATRYASTALAAIEEENSPNQPGVWPKPDPCGYTEMLKKTYPAVKAADPDMLVLNGGVGGTKSRQGSIPGATWVSDLYGFGAQGTFDALSFHPYSYPCLPSHGCPGRTWNDLPKVRQAMTANGDGAEQIWATEFGAPTNGPSKGGHVDEPTQSAIMVDAMKTWVTYSWAGPFCVYEFRDYGTNPTDQSDWFGIVSNNLKHKKPAFFAYTYLATGKGTPPPGF